MDGNNGSGRIRAESLRSRELGNPPDDVGFQSVVCASIALVSLSEA